MNSSLCQQTLTHLQTWATVFPTVAMDGENFDPMNLYRWLKGAPVKNLKIEHR